MAGASGREPLLRSEIHGFITYADLNFEKLKAEAAARWFRPNEIYAVLANNERFKVHAQPIDKPVSGTIVLYDRKVVRNFRKDGHDWKKKKDGKTVQEAHEKLKIGNEERVHVYYARGEHNPNFFRRCYWLLDKERMVAALLSAGANPSLVTDPTSDSPGGCTPADLAAKQGYVGLAAYLAEKGLTAHFESMSLSKDTGRSPSRTKLTKVQSEKFENLTEQELCLKESLAAYRNAADAASNIQAALRDRTLKLQTKAIQLANPEIQAAAIVAAMRIQHAFRNYNKKKEMRAAARIQNHFPHMEGQKELHKHAKTSYQNTAAYRGHQVRRQYRKVIWSVGVVEKAILRWRKKRKGLRGIANGMPVEMTVDVEPASTAEEGFFQASRQQAEDRFNRSVVRVQALFRCHRAQHEYRRMRIAHEEAKLEFSEEQKQGPGHRS
ncbi:hypothetical protein ACQ4PT_065483 [Festuca glaucescens]